MKNQTFLKVLLSLIMLVVTSNVSLAAKLKGKVRIDGSSTVYPITEAVAEEFRSVQPRIRVNIGVSGTGGGFKKFLANEIDINNASRRIKGKESKKAKSEKIDYLELPVAYDGLTIVINKKNDWAKELTSAELKMIWDRDSKVKMWSDIRKSWPKEKIKLYGPGTDSGTFDYFTKAINGKSGRSRSAFTKSEDDNVLVKGVAGSKYAMGYFGFAYYYENKGKLQSVAINGVSPTKKTINNGTYKPLSRPIFIYINKKSLKENKAVNTFIKFYIEKAGALSEEVGYISLPKEKYKESMKILESI